MNRRSRLILGALLAVAIVGGAILVLNSGDHQISVLNWNDYIGQFTDRDFTASYNTKVATTHYITNEEAYNFLGAQPSRYDVIFPSDYMITRLIREGKLERIDGLVPNFSPALIDQRAINQFRDGEWDQYCVPYLHGNSGFAVDTRKLNRGPGDVTWKWLASSDFAGNMIVIDDPRQVLGSVLIELGHDANSVEGNDLAEAVAVLQSLKGKIVEFTGDSIKERARAGGADVAFAWSGDALQLEGHLPNWKYAVPKFGGVRFQDGICVPRNAPHKDVAIKYLNFLLDPKVHVDIIETTLYPTTNRAARELASERYRKIEGTASDEDIHTEQLKDLSSGQLEAIRNAWAEVKR